MHSDDQLVALFRAGSDDAFRAIHDRYRLRLLAYSAQMLGGSRADAEDALQDVFVRAHQALRSSRQPIMLRAWLYRIAHNRCVDQLRRPPPIPSEIMPGAQLALSRGARHDPPTEAERHEDLRHLVADVHSLPEQQRSALLMRELQGLTYGELACALGVSVAGVKSLLLRARGGVVDAAAARDAPCADIRLELASAHDRGVRASGRARRHMRECDQCSSYRGQLRSLSRQVAALVPVGPLGHLGLLFGGGGAGAGAGAGGGVAASSSSALLGGAVTATATKVAAIVGACALVGGAGALQVTAPSAHHKQTHARPHAPRLATGYLSPPSPGFAAHTAGGTIAPSLATARLGSPALPTAPTSLNGQPQLSLASTTGLAIDPTASGQSSFPAVGVDPATLAPGAVAGQGAPTTSGSTSDAVGTSPSGEPSSGSNQASGPAGPAQSDSQGQTSTATPGSSSTQTQMSTPAAGSPAPSGTSATQGAGTATSSPAATAATVEAGPQAIVTSTQGTDPSAREVGSHDLAAIRTTGGTSSIGAITIHWQHRPHAVNSLHGAAPPPEHYLSVSAIH